MRLYEDLTPFYRWIDPVAEHADEAEAYLCAFERILGQAPATLLDLGAGAGNNAFHLKRRFRCTLSDISPSMLDLSRAQNPECEHIKGDMRTLRLGRTFDAVLVHDAVAYMATESDLTSAIRTAFLHTRPGGAALFTPDVFAENFSETAQTGGGGDEVRALQFLEWAWDPDPTDTNYRVEFILTLREHGAVRVVHDAHVEGLFPRTTWTRLLQEAGYEPELISRPISEGEHDEVFLCRRPH